MKKSFIVALLVSLMFLVACTEKVSDEKLRQISQNYLMRNWIQ